MMLWYISQIQHSFNSDTLKLKSFMVSYCILWISFWTLLVSMRNHLIWLSNVQKHKFYLNFLWGVGRNLWRNLPNSGSLLSLSAQCGYISLDFFLHYDIEKSNNMLNILWQIGNSIDNRHWCRLVVSHRVFFYKTTFSKQMFKEIDMHSYQCFERGYNY